MAASYTPVLLFLVVALLAVIVVLLLRPAPPASPTAPPVIVMQAPPRPERLRRAPPTPMEAEKAYGGTTLTYRTVPTETPEAARSLSPYYPEISRGIPTDFTMESCPCPYSKPQKTDLPMPSMPLCTLLQQSSYKLSQFQ